MTNIMDQRYYMDTHEVGAVLDRVCGEQGMTRHALAKQAGISSRRLSMISRNQRWVSEEVVERLFTALGLVHVFYTEDLTYYRFGEVPSPYK